MEKKTERTFGEQTPEKSKKRRERYTHYEVSDMRASLESILDQLRDKIDAGTYFMIIGDDASGRVPALVLDRFLKAEYKEKGYIAPKTIFIAGSGSGGGLVGQEKERKQELLNKLAEQIPVPGAPDGQIPAGMRVLIVTDAVVTGMSLTPLMFTLKARGVPFDIAALGMDRWAPRERLEQEFNAQVVAGSGDIWPSVMHQENLSGVRKKEEELFSHSIRDELTNKEELKYPDRQKLQQDINETRQDVDLLAGQLRTWYKRNKK